MNIVSGTARLLTLVFTDLVGSTRLKADQGDLVAGERIARHRLLVDQFREEYGGRVVDWAGDGCFLTFEIPSAAVAFGLRLQRVHGGDSELPKVRVGIHVGEVTESLAMETALRVEGLAVDLTARIQSLALPGQLLMSASVFNSARQRLGCDEFGACIEWRAHGAYHLQGFDDAIEVCEAGFEGLSPLTTPRGSEKASRVVAPGEEDTLGWRPAVGLAVPGREHWQLERQLGKGGFGEVWRAVHATTHEQRVFKFCFESERVRGLKREVVLFRLLKEALGVRNDIARVLDWQFDKPPYFLEAEYTEGGDLKAWAEAHGGLAAVPLELRLDLVAQAAEALAAAHSIGVLHKDIKPENLLIFEDTGPNKARRPLVRLTDFGIGLITNPEALHAQGITAAGLTQTLVASTSSSTSGTRMYMAPELIEGRPPTTLSDIYALGVLLYQMVIADFSRVIAPGWERDVADALLRDDIALCVDGRPENRLQSAREIAGRLRNLEERRKEELARRQMMEAAEEAARAAERNKRRRRQFLLISCCFIGLILATALVAVREYRRAGEQHHLRLEAEAARKQAEAAQEQAEAQSYSANIMLTQTYVENRQFDSARELLWKTSEKRRNWEWGCLLHACDQALQTFPSTEPPCLSSDGLRVMTVSTENTAAVWEVATGKKLASVDITDCNDLKCDADLTRIMAVFEKERTVRVWDALSGKELTDWGIKMPEGEAWRMGSFSNDGSRWFTLPKTSGQCNIWNVHTGSKTATLPSPVKEFSPDGKWVLTISETGDMKAWDADTGDEKALLETGGAASTASIAVFNSAARRLVTASGRDDRVTVWDTGTMMKWKTLRTGSGVVSRALFSPNGARLASSSPYNSTRVWNLETGQQLLACENHRPTVFSQDGRFLATLLIVGEGAVSAVKIWDIDAGKEFSTLAGAGDHVSSCLFSPNGSQVATGTLDGSVKVWDVKSGGLMGQFTGPAGWCTPKAFIRDERTLVTLSTASVDVTELEVSPFVPFDTQLFLSTTHRIGTTLLPAGNAVALSELLYESVVLTGGTDSGERLVLFDARPYLTTHAALAPDGRRLATSIAKDLFLWDVPSGARSGVTIEQPEDISGVVISPDSRCAATGSWKGVLRIWDMDSGSRVAECTREGVPISPSAFSPDGTRIAARCGSNSAVVFDLHAGKALLEMRNEKGGAFSALVFSPDGRRMVSTFAQGSRMWDVDSGAMLFSLGDESCRPSCAAFSPDGTRLATGSLGNVGALWDAASGEELAALRGHAGPITSVSYAPNGTRIVTASSDGTARIWDAANGLQCAVLQADDAHLVAARFTPDGKEIVGLSEKGIVQRWTAVPWTADQLPGDASMAWRQRSEVLRDLENEKRRSAAEPVRIPVQRVVTTRQNALSGLQTIVQALPDDARDNVLRATRREAGAPDPWCPIRYLCLRAGDRISSLNGTETPDATALRAAVQTAMEALKANPDAPLALDIVKANRTRRLIFRFQETEIIHRETTFPVDALRFMLQEGVPFMEREAARCRQYLGRAAAFFGTPPDNMDGIQIDNDGGTIGAQLMDMWGIGIGDQILAINGIPMKGFDALMEAVHGLQKNVESGGDEPLVIEFERGLYRRIVQTIKFK